MRGKLSIRQAGLSTSAVLAVPYALVLVVSVLLVGKLTTGSWLAALLGISWSTLAGFEIGFLGVVVVSFAIAWVFVPSYNAVRRRFTRSSNHAVRPNAPGRPVGPSWAIGLLTACLGLPALALIAFRLLATFVSFGGLPGVASTPPPELQAQPANLGSAINTAMREAEPSFTADGRTMYFNCGNSDICVSHLVGTWEGGNWTSPEKLGPPINTEYEEIEAVINGAGDTLYFTSFRPQGFLKHIPFLSSVVNVFEIVNTLATPGGRTFFGGLGLEDVWVSYRINGAWSEPQNINDVPDEPHINSSFADHCLFFSADGNEAFWTSTRPGGFGDNDIWTARRVDGNWTEPENLGPNVNRPGSEHTSIPTPDGRSLYVTTTRAEGFGGEDTYVTSRDSDGTWGPLVNLGPLVNGPGDDRCPAWTPDLRIFLFDSVREGSFGARDIWWVYFKDVAGYPASDNLGALPNLALEAQTSGLAVPY